MELTPEEARVLGCLIEKEAAVPDSYPLTPNALRLACNQTSSRDPIVAYDDRTVETALVSLKSQGLVRFVHASHGARTTRYRHSADERWRMERPELAVLSVLVLRGPQTVGELRTRSERQYTFGELTEVEAVLDALAARTPDPFVVRLERRPGERDARWAHLLTGEPPPQLAYAGPIYQVAEPRRDEVAALVERITQLERRLSRIESDLGIDSD
ncbi:MAG: YceH family protein [Acidimicrobiales bacterium]